MMSGDAASSTLFRVGLFADIQYGDKDDLRSKHYRLSLLRASNSVQWLNDRTLDCVVNLGDIVEGDHSPGPETVRELDLVLATLEPLRVPLYHVIGNHCLYVDLPKSEVIKRLGYADSVAYCRFLHRSASPTDIRIHS